MSNEKVIRVIMVLELVDPEAVPVFEEYDLTTREKQVLGLLVNGLSYKMIAGNMNVGLETVKTHIRNLYEKLDVHNQSEAVSKALRNRLIH